MNEITPSKTSLSRAILPLILLIGSVNARAQFEVVTLADPVDVKAASGQVKDPNEVVIDGAHVDLLDLQTEKIIISTTTDNEGNFHFKDFGKNTYKLKIVKPGFNILQVTIRIRKHSPARAILTLPIAT
ncbi:MAG TPA: carboxypeptidase-like regulatory domain-containing protein [Edaphobacter sp.]|nr:carboxypeptidase-like regulatory domain-containing protein [Edaphobacter sp.]